MSNEIGEAASLLAARQLRDETLAGLPHLGLELARAPFLTGGVLAALDAAERRSFAPIVAEALSERVADLVAEYRQVKSEPFFGPVE